MNAKKALRIISQIALIIILLQSYTFPVIQAEGPATLEKKPAQGWVAGETSVSKLSPEARARLVSLPADTKAWEKAQAKLRSGDRSLLSYSYPASVDWRNVNGQNWTTAVRDQGGCGSCAVFASVAAIESRLEIANNNAALNPDLSEAHMFYSGCGACCLSGWYVDAALNFAMTPGVATETCYPYSDYDQAAAPCADWQNQATTIDSWVGVSNIAAMKQAIFEKGPIVANMAVYTDYYYYTSGVYRYSWGILEGYHAITLVGYDDAGGYWIAKNSWGTYWGEAGWFKIAYGQCEVDIYAYVPSLPAAPAPTPTNTVAPQPTATPTWTPLPTNTALPTNTPAPTMTPSTTFGDIKGTVTGSNGKGLSGVTVTTDSGQSAITNATGKYTLNNVPTGSRVANATKSGYANQSKTVSVSTNKTVTADFQLTTQ